MGIQSTIIFSLMILPSSLQNCSEEVTSAGISVTWHETPTANHIESDPQCYNNDTHITRNCANSTWIPNLDELLPCLKVVKYFDPTACPPGFNKVSEANNNYCYQIGEPSAWNYPCLASGGASVISDLSSIDTGYFINSLREANISRYFWVPAYRQKRFHPIVWTIPGPNWGIKISPGKLLRLQSSFDKNCLLLDIEQNLLTTDFCHKIYPSLCFYLNNLYYPATCPIGYYSFRFTADHGACYGIARADSPQGLRFTEFLNKKCNKPMTDTEIINRFVFKQIAEMSKLPNDVWCWFKTTRLEYSVKGSSSTSLQSFEGIINNAGVLGYADKHFTLSCMACEAEVMYTETELMFDYNEVQNVIYLTIYHPSGLWKYNDNDRGIQCFSNAKGFVKVIKVNDIPFMEIKPFLQNTEFGKIEKIVYVINLVTNSSAQYWCEGHTVNFSLITTNKLIVNPRGNKIHVFALVITYYVLVDSDYNIIGLSDLVTNITNIFKAQKVLVMDISDSISDPTYITLHLHIDVTNTHEDIVLNIQSTYNSLKDIAMSELANYNYTFLNLSSSVYCLPTVSSDIIELNWDMTPIGQFAAPHQFCLQANGLPVKRRCEGSYMLGGFWGEVEGHCDNTYAPSRATTFLYNFLKTSDRYITHFLNEGLSYVLADTDIIIPADIYYLSVSLQQISEIAHDNVTSIETTDMNHIAWVMDRVTILDCEYLRLAQTLNSTNVIVDAISDIIEIIAENNFNNTYIQHNNDHQLAIEPLFVVQISYPHFNNITGIAVVNKTSSHYFTDELIYPLYKNTTLEDVLAIENLEIAAWIPTNVIDSILKLNESEDDINNHNKFHVTITLYHNDAVFQEIHKDKHIINSRIIGISIPEYYITNLEHPVPILFKQFNETTNSFCGYWEFQPQSLNNVPGSWKKQGCYMIKSINGITICECYHLTHFGQLFLHSRKNDVSNTGHSVALNIITLVGSFLSLIGITGIWITALLFSNWRKKASTKILLQLSTAIALPLIFIVIFNLDYSIFVFKNNQYIVAEHMKITCIVLGALLHFSILASFMWMLITAILQFIRYVRVLGVLRPARFMIKFTLIGWGIPLFPVIITLALDSYNYIPAPSTNKKICYPNGNYLIAVVLVPICVILFVNISLFLSVLYSISKGSNIKMKSTDMDLVSAQLRVSIFLFFLLGLTWIFGVFSFSDSLIWSYLFCLTSTLQGFVLFIYFVICDPSTRGLWVTLMKPQVSSNSSRQSISNISTG